MPWVRIDDGFARHPKVAAAGPLAIAMQVAALCYCNREMTDGFVPRSVARTLVDWEVISADGRVHQIAHTCGMSGDDVTCQWVIDILVSARMWHEVEGGYQIHDYADYQATKADIQAMQATKSEAGKRGADSRWHGKRIAPAIAPAIANEWQNDADAIAENSESAEKSEREGDITSKTTDDLTKPQDYSVRTMAPAIANEWQNDAPTPYPIPTEKEIDKSISLVPEPESDESTPIQKPPKYTAQFEAFWKAYPGSNGVKLKSYQQWQRLKPFDREAAAAALPAWVNCQRWREGYVKACETWLRDRMWEQDPPADKPSPNGKHIPQRDNIPARGEDLGWSGPDSPFKGKVVRIGPGN